jgi:hypothetical protein
MYGENGTEREVEAAEKARRPVIFLNSDKEFRGWQKAKLTKDNTAETAQEAVQKSLNFITNSKGLSLQGDLPSSMVLNLSKRKSDFYNGLKQM